MEEKDKEAEGQVVACSQEPLPKKVGLLERLFPVRASGHQELNMGLPVDIAAAARAAAQDGGSDSECGELVDTVSPSYAPLEPSAPSFAVLLQHSIYKFANAASRKAKELQQKLIAPVQDFHDARAQLEKQAKDARGKEREAMIRRWCDELGAANAPARLLGTLTPRPLTMGSSPGTEGEWQQLQVPQGTVIADEERRSEGVLYRDSTREGAELFTFRELFLRSRALEQTIAGYALSPPANEEEQDLLAQLFKACLNGDPNMHAKAVADLTRLAQAQLQCQDAGAKSEELQSLASCIAQCVNGIKRQAEAEAIERRILLLQSDIRDRAADAAHRHVFNSGESEPVGDCSPQKLERGLAATAEVMGLLEQLCGLVAQQRVLVDSSDPPPFEDVLSTMNSKYVALADEVAATKAAIAATQQEHLEQEVEREEVVTSMAADLSEVNTEIAELEDRQNALLLQLREVETQLVKARAKRTEKEESRSAYDDLTTFSLLKLQQKAEELTRDQRRREAQSTALDLGSEVVANAQTCCATVIAQQAAAARLAQNDAERELIAATTRHCYFQRGELQLLLRRAQFCAGELSSQLEKAEELARMGMASMLAELQKQRRSCQAKYLEAETAALARLQEVADIQASISHLCRINVTQSLEGSVPFKPSTVDKTEHASKLASDKKRIVEELCDLLASIDEVGCQLRGLPRPLGLPPPGHPLPPDPDEPETDINGSPTGSGGALANTERPSRVSADLPRPATSRRPSDETACSDCLHQNCATAQSEAHRGSSGLLSAAFVAQAALRQASDDNAAEPLCSVARAQSPTIMRASSPTTEPPSLIEGNMAGSLGASPRSSLEGFWDPTASPRDQPCTSSAVYEKAPVVPFAPALRTFSFDVAPTSQMGLRSSGDGCAALLNTCPFPPDTPTGVLTMDAGELGPGSGGCSKPIPTALGAQEQPKACSDTRMQVSSKPRIASVDCSPGWAASHSTPACVPMPKPVGRPVLLAPSGPMQRAGSGTAGSAPQAPQMGALSAALAQDAERRATLPLAGAGGQGTSFCSVGDAFKQACSHEGPALPHTNLGPSDVAGPQVSQGGAGL